TRATGFGSARAGQSCASSDNRRPGRVRRIVPDSSFRARPCETPVMRIRHRIPSVFSLSMVDVMCCALGCVILLWLFNLKNAKDNEERAEENKIQSGKDLAATQKERDDLKGLL